MIILLTFAVLAATPGATLASDVVEEITVTATRRAESIKEISAAIAVVNESAIEPVLTDSLREAVGVYVQQTTPGQGAVILRGLKGSAVLHLVDDMRLNNAIFRNAPTQYFSLVPSAAVERIEIVRGSPTSLYGSDAVGGVVQAVTRVPSFDSAGRRGNISIRMDTAELERSLDGSIEFGNTAYAVALSGSLSATGNRRIGKGPRVGPSDFESRSLRAILSATPSEEIAWFVDAHFLEQPETARFDELVAGFGQSLPDSSRYSFKPNRRAFLHGQYSQSFTNMDWSLDAAWQRIDDDRETQGFASDNLRLEQNRSDLFGVTSRWSGNAGETSWISGAEIYFDKVASSRDQLQLSSGVRERLAARFPDGSDILQAAIFANAHRHFSDRLQLGGGLRFSHIAVDLAETSLTPAAELDVGDVSADLGAIYALNDNYQFTANVGYGFRAPNIFDLGTLGNRPGNRFNIPNTSLDSEKVVQMDVGFRWFASASSMEVMLFILDYTDRITSVSTDAETIDGRDIVRSENAASAKLYGVEAGFDVSLTSDLRLRGGFTYTHGEQTVAELTEPSDRVPPLSGFLNADFALSERSGLQAGIRFADKQDRLSARDQRDNRINPDGTAGWMTVNVGSSFDLTRNTSLQVRLDNVLDKRFRYHGSGIDAPGRSLSVHFTSSWQ